MTFVLERDVPAPPRPRRGRREFYPWSQMQVGDSFVAANRARWAAQFYKRSHPGWDYTSKSQPDGRVRIWRLA